MGYFIPDPVINPSTPEVASEMCVLIHTGFDQICNLAMKPRDSSRLSYVRQDGLLSHAMIITLDSYFKYNFEGSRYLFVEQNGTQSAVNKQYGIARNRNVPPMAEPIAWIAGLVEGCDVPDGASKLPVLMLRDLSSSASEGRLTILFLNFSVI